MASKSCSWISSLDFDIGDHRYRAKKSSLPYKVKAGYARSLATIVHIAPNDTVDAHFLRSRVQLYLEQDDVFRLEFLEGIIFQGVAEKDIEFDADLRELLSIWSTQWTAFEVYANGGPPTPPGPYVLDSGELFEVWRIYDDVNQAFILSTWLLEGPKQKFGNLHLGGDASQTLAIAVPSRLYYAKSKELPLNGMRIAIKDIFHLSGVRTSCCSRAYHDLYPPQESTAGSIQRLVSLGAIIVGKTHASAFALKEEPTECVDYPAPFNPRADGYQTPAGSSSGSGAAIASYDWLDLTLGTDTTGSGRRPALWNGCFALRPSPGVVPSDGMVSTFPKFDSPSFFGRDIAAFKDFVLAWYERDLQPPSKVGLPSAILYPSDYLPIANTEQMILLDKFVDDLATHLEVTPQTISMAKKWAQTSPVEEKNLEIYMQNVTEHGFFYEAYHCFDEFRREYQEKYKKPPYMSEVNSWMWGIGRLLSSTQHDAAMEKFTTFRKWFYEEILKPEKQNAIMVLPIEMLEPRYRDQPPAVPSIPPSGLSVLYLSPTLGAPEIVVPVGQVPFHSRISNRNEFLPVAVSVLGAPDTDVELIDMVQQCLLSSGRPTSVQTGSTMFGNEASVDAKIPKSL